jgi:hypothetical protein
MKKISCPSCGQEINSTDCCRTGANHYIFNWLGGGYNSTWADSPEDAVRKCSLGSLKVDPTTVRPYTYEESERMNRAYGPYD